jgi:hypothetical protein
LRRNSYDDDEALETCETGGKLNRANGSILSFGSLGRFQDVAQVADDEKESEVEANALFNFLKSPVEFARRFFEWKKSTE